MESSCESVTSSGCTGDVMEATDPFQNRRLSQVVAQIFESSTCINQLETCESCEEDEDEDEEEDRGREEEDIETDFIDYKEEPKNKELFRETFRQIEEFLSRDSPIRVNVTDTDGDNNLSDLSAVRELIEKKELDVENVVDSKDNTEEIKGENKCKCKVENKNESTETKRKNDMQSKIESSTPPVPKRETEINDIESNIVVIGDSVVQMRHPVRRFVKDYDFASIGANSTMQTAARHSSLHYSNLCPKPMLTNSSIETTFGVTPPEQRSSLRSIRRARSPDCKRVSPTFRWSVTSV